MWPRCTVVQRTLAVQAIEDALESGNLPQGVASRLTKARNSLEDKFTVDGIVGALRDREGIPVYEVVDDLGTLRIVQHDKKASEGLRSLENAIRDQVLLDTVDYDLKALFAGMDGLLGLTP